ncbi:MAG: uroporphyrinogen decarboxylase [Alphaproteobacteria bacterium]|nr:uroporphyrinogen decarboxylase [Alphaproteobacteria bacterium]
MTEKKIVETLRGKRQSRPPVWFMRQAGRYLPEYRQVRARTDDFLSLCYNPRLAREVTMQPVRRFDLDAAILFSDILVIPDALGQAVRFEEGTGPVLEPLDEEAIDRLDASGMTMRLAPVFETVADIRAELDRSKTLLGFCGAPWTVATYMIGGRSSTDQAATKRFALEKPDAFNRLISVLVEASVDYLVAQLRAGADVVQVFESWAGNIDEEMFRAFVIAPNRRIVEGVRQSIAGAAMIGFPRGAGPHLISFAEKTGYDAIGLDQTVPLAFASTAFDATKPLQGNLDPMRLVVGGAQLDRRIDEIISAFSDRPHIFNLGHGIVPETPIEHVEQMVARVKGN